MKFKHSSLAISFFLHFLVIAYAICIIQINKNLNVIQTRLVAFSSLHANEFQEMESHSNLKKTNIDNQHGITTMANKVVAKPKANSTSQLSQVITNQDNNNETLVSLLHSAIAKVQTYPEQSLALEQSGVVRIAFLLSPTGNTSEIHIIQSSGYAVLDNAALQAVMKATPFIFAKSYLRSARLFSVDVDYES